MRTFNAVLLASLNKGKFVEFEKLLAAHHIKLAHLQEFVRNSNFLSHVKEDGKTYYDNAFKKCLAAFQAAKVPTISDDSGLEVLGLEGKPGIHSARFAEAKAAESQDKANRQKLLTSLKGKKGEDRKARFVCNLVFMVEGVVLKAEGVCSGRIAEAEKGEHGFAYDSLFIPDEGDGRSFAEMSAEEKDRISHRARALESLVEQFKDREIEFVRP